MTVHTHNTPVRLAAVETPDREGVSLRQAQLNQLPGPTPPATRVEGLLGAVVAACECMVQHADLLSGLQAAVAQLGRLSGHDRAYVWELTDAQSVCVLVAVWDAPGIPRIADMAGTDRFAVAEFEEVWTPLLAGQAYQSVTPAKTGANARLNEAVANRSDLMVPIFVGTQCWGCIGFDNCREERRYSAAEIQALRGAAAAVAAAVHRSQSDARRATEAQRHRQLLAAVNEASAHLVAQPDLPTALELALDRLRAHTGVDRVFVNRYCSTEQATYFWIESHRQGLPPFVAGFGPGPWPDDAFAEVAYPLREGRTYRSSEDGRSGANAKADSANERRSDLIVPVMVAGRYRACIGFDDCTQARHWSDAEVTVLQTAASAIAAALARHDAEEARLAQERERTAEVLALNSLLEGVVQSSRELLDAPDFKVGLQQWLEVLARAVDADKAVVGTVAPSADDATLADWQVYWSKRVDVPAPPVPATSDFIDWHARVLRGEAVWAHREELLDPASVRYWQDTDCWTNLLMPIVSAESTLGFICFDWPERREWQPAFGTVLRTAADSVAAAIQRHEATQALLAERERRIEVEQARADEAARHAARIERHARLLAAVAASAEDLLACADPANCMGTVLARVGEVTHAERVCLARLDWTPHDLALHGWQEIAHEWARPGVARQMDGPLRRFAMQRGDATWDATLKQFASERRILATIDSADEPFRSKQLALGIVWTLCYPVLVEGQVWGLMGMDYATPFTGYDEADLAALQTVATTIADAMLRRTLEQRALATERARVDEAQALNHLLESVVQSSRELLDAPDFQTGLRQWLEVLARAVDADVAMLGSSTRSADSDGVAAWHAHWSKSGAPMAPPVPATSDFVDWHGRLQRGEAVWAHREDLLDPVSVRYWQDTDCWTNLLVPVVSAGGTLGFLCFDWRERREWQPAFGTVLRTAADSVAAAIQRHEATQALLAERDRRSSELARANEALRQSLDALAGAGGETAFMSRSLLRLQDELGAQAAYLFRSDGTGQRLRLLGRATLGSFSTEPAADDPAMFTEGFDMVPALLAELKRRGRLLWRRVDADAPVGADTSESTRWHLRLGHRANAVHALMVGERQVGFIGLVFDTEVPPREAELDLAHALCQPITLSLELARLSRLAQRGSEQNAVLAERSRLAREIHDGIAQSFLAIQMQLDMLDAGVQHQPPVQRALDMARHGLTEARRAVAALRPQGLLNQDLPGSVRRLLAQLEARSAVQCVLDSPQAWLCLPPDVQDHLFRIVQEAANNVLKHASARHLRVELSQAAGEATVLIADDGVGFDPAAVPAGHGFGLESMQQRAQLMGARIDWLSRPGKGTQVLVSWSRPAAPQPGTAFRVGP